MFAADIVIMIINEGTTLTKNIVFAEMHKNGKSLSFSHLYVMTVWLREQFFVADELYTLE